MVVSVIERSRNTETPLRLRSVTVSVLPRNSYTGYIAPIAHYFVLARKLNQEIKASYIYDCPVNGEPSNREPSTLCQLSTNNYQLQPHQGNHLCHIFRGINAMAIVGSSGQFYFVASFKPTQLLQRFSFF